MSRVWVIRDDDPGGRERCAVAPGVAIGWWGELPDLTGH